MTRLMGRLRSRPARLWRTRHDLPARNYFELPFRIYPVVRECLRAIFARIGRDDTLEALRQYRITVTLDLWGDQIQINADAASRTALEQTQDDIVVLEAHHRVFAAMVEQLDARRIYDHLRYRVLDELAERGGGDFKDLICNVERWEETSRNQRTPWGEDERVFVVRLYVRKETGWTPTALPR